MRKVFDDVSSMLSTANPDWAQMKQRMIQMGQQKNSSILSQQPKQVRALYKAGGARFQALLGENEATRADAFLEERETADARNQELVDAAENQVEKLNDEKVEADENYQELKRENRVITAKWDRGKLVVIHQGLTIAKTTSLLTTNAVEQIQAKLETIMDKIIEKRVLT
mmetsp:Transcript_32823/g.59221  ORF Transcript_32823/g.59221 Transcript_32823/m.59221 type:complete len:169 (+) Transcript_32823:3-509(+)